MEPHEHAAQLLASCLNQDLNEADTRHRIIDQILHEVLSWPRHGVQCESPAGEGFIDYVLTRPNGTPALVIEAKRTGAYFELPARLLTSGEAHYIQLRSLLTSESIKRAAHQARAYCIEIGCPFACITNGSAWIFFRSFQSGESWISLRAMVIPGLHYFQDRFTEAENALSYLAITERFSLHKILGSSTVHNREFFYPKKHIYSFDAQMELNDLAPQLRPVLEKYFGVIDESDYEFMERCYVLEGSSDRTVLSVERTIADSVTPFLKSYNISDSETDKSGGQFGRRLVRSVLNKNSGEVIVLFGGKGVGKSTFARRLLFHKPPEAIRSNALIAMIDLLAVPETRDRIHQEIWGALVTQLDVDKLLQASRDQLLTLFSDRFEIAVNQDLYGLPQESEAFNVRLNSLVRDWLQDKKYCARRLASTFALRGKTILVVIDNTDQFSPELQDFCFTIAHEIRRHLGCLVIISMREERFVSSSIHGTLDAFPNSGFHIASPSPPSVFLRRVRYVLELLQNDDLEKTFGAIGSKDQVQRFKRLFRIFENEFKTERSHLSQFLTACAHGNIRLTLEMFRSFVLSGYTNIFEMTSAKHLWVIQNHQVLKPMMIPRRFYYEESESYIPNIYQIRTKPNGSHFTAIRILFALSNGVSPTNPPYIPVHQLRNDFDETFDMREDFETNLDMMLKSGLVEANNRIDTFSHQLDSIRITMYGFYFLNTLSRDFPYVELVSADCAFASQIAANEIASFSNEEYALWMKQKRQERLQKRLDKAECFIRYLQLEENREIDHFGLQDRPRLVPQLREAFQLQKDDVIWNALKQLER